MKSCIKKVFKIFCWEAGSAVIASGARGEFIACQLAKALNEGLLIGRSEIANHLKSFLDWFPLAPSLSLVQPIIKLPAKIGLLAILKLVKPGDDAQAFVHVSCQ